MKVFDAHIHLIHCDSLPLFPDNVEYNCISCALTPEEYDLQQKYIEQFFSEHTALGNTYKIYTSFGIHPQNPVFEYVDFLESLLKDNKIDAVGECGFDFFTEEFKATRPEQEKCWNAQIELAVKYNIPLIVHGRKCSELFFRDVKLLRKVPAVIFHGWFGTIIEAQSLLEKGVNCYFSFGKPLIRGKKSAAECVKNLASDRILLETDGPYETLKGEKQTSPLDLLEVYKKAGEICGKPVNFSFEKIFNPKVQLK